MKLIKLIGILCILPIVSCTNDKTDQFALKLEFEEYTLMSEENISFQVMYKLSPNLPNPDYVFSPSEVTFESKIEEKPKILLNETMRKQLTLQLPDVGIDPNEPYVYRLQVLSNRFSAINIKADKKYRDIEAGNSLNSCFILAGLFILDKNGDYSFYEPYRKKINLLEESLLNMEDLIFPANFMIGVTHPPLNEDSYTFTIEFMEVGGDHYSIPLPQINLKTE